MEITQYINLLYPKMEQRRDMRTLDISERNLTGHLALEGFTNLTYLDCGYNQIESIDTSNLDNLTYLDCSNNKLGFLDTTPLKKLKVLAASSNKIEFLDTENLTNLTYLNLQENKLIALVTESLKNLICLNVSNNPIGYLDTESLSNLVYLNASLCELKNLDVSPLVKLNYLYCFFNQIPTLEIENLPDLAVISCKNSEINRLKIANLPSLTVLDYSGNGEINLELGNNITGLAYVDCSGNLTADPETKWLIDNKEKLACLYWTEENQRKEIINSLGNNKELRMKIWNYFRNAENHSYRKTAQGISKLVDISDLDSWVENYDASKRGDLEYHKICGKNAGFTELNWFSLRNLAQKVFARCLIEQNRLLNGVCEKWEEKVNEQVEKECSFYHLNPIATDLVRHIHFGGFGCTEDLQNLIREKSLRIEKERELETILTELQTTLTIEKEDKSTQVTEQVVKEEMEALVLDYGVQKRPRK